MLIEQIIKALETKDVKAIAVLLNDDHIEYSEQENPTPMETVGQLVDKLSIVNNKMWANQEILYVIRRMSVEEFTAKWSNDLAGLHTVIKRCTDLNVQRSRLMDEIDQRLVDAFTGKIKPDQLSAKQHKTY